MINKLSVINMSKIKKFFTDGGPVSIILSVILSVLLVVSIVEAATIIGTNISTGGTVEMTGFKLTTSPANSYVLTSDVDGIGTWQATGGDGTVATKIVATQSSLASSTANYVCDGTDDEVEINQAINALPSTGGIVYLLEGTYNVNPQTVIIGVGDGYTAIKIATSSVSLVGSGAGTIIKLKDNWTDGDLSGYEETYIIYMSSADSVFLENFKIDGNKANQSSDVEYYYGIYVNDSNKSKMNKLYVEDIRAGDFTDAAGIYLKDSSASSTISHSYFSGIDESAVIMSFSSGNIFSNNIIENNGNQNNEYTNAIILYNGNSNIISSNIISFNTKNGIFSRAPDTIISNNLISYNSKSGISLDYSSESINANNSLVNANYIGSNGQYGIYFDGGVNRVIISNNIIEDNDVNNTASYDGIYISNGDDNIITGNFLKDNDRYEINIAHSSSDDNYIIGNKITGTDHVGEINDVGTDTKYSQIIGSDNILVKNSGSVGIGTTTPASLLHVSNNTATTTIAVGDELTGGKGSCLKLRDSDDAGWTYCYVLDGTMTCGATSCE